MKRRIIFCAIIIALFVCSFFAISYLPYLKTKTTLNKTIAKIENEKNDELALVSEIKKTYKNNEIVGILEIPNEDYKAVITQSSDNKKYLNHDEYGNKNKIGNPFLDYRVNINDSNKILIYGHNSRYVDMPFKVLENYYDYDYFKNHKYILIKTEEKTFKYEIFSVYVETSDWDYMKIDFKNEDEWQSHLNKLKNNSIYDTEVEVSGEDKILVLQTCSTKKEYRSLAKKFLLVISRRVD